MRFAKANKSTIEPFLEETTREWMYEDRVFCLLHPEYQSKISEYYVSEGPPLRKLLSKEEIKSLDSECNKIIRKRFYISKVMAIRDSQLVDSYFAVKDKLGRVPTLVELGNYGKYGQRIWHKRFGGYRAFLERLGEPKPITKKPKQKNLVKKHAQLLGDEKLSVGLLMEEYLARKTELNRPPSIFEMGVWDADEFNLAVKSFGGWERFLKFMGHYQ
ncbi:MAG: hypothetical protein R3F42_09000 [Pseudomonadota bacterium]